MGWSANADHGQVFPELLISFEFFFIINESFLADSGRLRQVEPVPANRLDRLD